MAATRSRILAFGYSLEDVLEECKAYEATLGGRTIDEYPSAIVGKLTAVAEIAGMEGIKVLCNCWTRAGHSGWPEFLFRVGKLDAAAIFPGLLEPGAEALPHALVHIDTTEVSQWRSTGLYAAPGEPITVELPAAAAGQGLFVRIGCSISTLTERASDVQRFPQMWREFDLETTSTLAANAVGGPVCAISQITTLFAILIYSNSYI